MSQKSSDFKMPVFRKGLQLHSKKQFLDLCRNAQGVNLFTRYYPADQYVTKAEQDGLWLEKRKPIGVPLSEITIKDPQNNIHKGLNFASNNYLGLAHHPFTIEAGTQAGKLFGVNSAGSPLAFGATKYYSQLREEISEFLNATALIFSSAWLACFGFIKAVAKDYDHVLLDELCDPALFEGARYTTKSVHSFKHLDEKDMESKLRELRSTKKNGILVVTDCLFNMDSSSPNLINYQKITSEYQAYLLLNIGHDFGIFGPTGKGIWEEQGLSELNNVFFVGSGSKTLGVNYGFIALPGAKGALISFWKYFCSTYMFTNAINPIQANSGLATLRMARSHLGSQLREKVLSNAKYLREGLSALGHNVLGRVSPFVCVKIGNEVMARIVVKILMENDIFVNVVEYPHAELGCAAIRMSLTPEHSQQQLDQLIKCFDWSYRMGKGVFQEELSRSHKEQTAKL